MHKENRNFNIKRSAFIAALCYGAAAAYGIITKRPESLILTLPTATIVSASSLFPIILSHTFKKKVNDESYFYEHKRNDIMKAARDYVTEYNLYEREKQAKGR